MTDDAKMRALLAGKLNIYNGVVVAGARFNILPGKGRIWRASKEQLVWLDPLEMLKLFTPNRFTFDFIMGQPIDMTKVGV